MQIEITDKKIKNAVKVEFQKKDKIGEIDYEKDVIKCNMGKKKVGINEIKKVLSNLLDFIKKINKNTIIDINEFDENISSYIFHYLILSEGEIKNLKNEQKKKNKEKIIYLQANKKLLPTLSKTSIVSDSINYVRELNLLPGNIATPTYIHEEAKKMSKEWKLKYDYLDFEKIEELNMNAFMSVAKGSYNEPVIPIIKYTCKGTKKTILLVGKGITFDTGGISLKPSKGMDEMKYDKSGAITVMGIMRAISEIQPEINVIGIIPLCENMPSGNATRPGDVVTAYNGKSIEILNTDAEGRMILADALAYGIDKFKPDYVIDMATLTGASSIALGSNYIAMLGNNQEFIELMNKSSEKSFDKIWNLPLTEEFSEMMKSKFADIKNVSETGEAGTITAAAFLSFFVDKTKWIHLDIASTAYTKGKGPISFGPTGSGLSVVVETILNLQNKK
jgi:leucyl aminopeptidase